MKNHTPYLQIAIGAAMISFSAVFVRLTVVGPIPSAFYRMFFGGFFLLLIAWWRKEDLRIGVANGGYALLSGLFFALDLSFWHQSVVLIGPGLATVLVNLQVFLLGILGILFYRERSTWKFYSAFPLALLGLYFLIGYHWGFLSANYRMGIYQCLIAMLWYTAYILALRRSQNFAGKLPLFTNLAWVSLLSSGFLLIIGEMRDQVFWIPHWQDLFYLLCYGLFAQVFGWLLISRGLPRAKISIAGFLLLLQPALAMIWDILFFKRPTTSWEILGAIIIFVAIYLSLQRTVVRSQQAERDRVTGASPDQTKKITILSR
jgi:drug/metabolite transporter (DMT)-like permease